MTMVISLLFTLGLVAGDQCMNLVNTDFPRLSAAFNMQASACRGHYSPVTPAKAFNDKIFTSDGGACWAYQVSANRYRFVMTPYTEADAQLYADPASSSWGQGNFYETAAATGSDLLDNIQCGPVGGCWNGNICSCQEFSDHYATWNSVTWGRAESNMPARLWWSANSCRTQPSCGIPIEIEININELASTSIYPSTWDPTTPVFGGTLPHEMGWAVSTVDECKALCDAESRCTAWQTNSAILDPTFGPPTVYCHLFDRDVTGLVRATGKTLVGLRCPTPAPAPQPAGPCKIMLKSGGKCLHTQSHNATPMYMNCPAPGTQDPFFQFELIPVAGQPNNFKIQNNRGQYLSYQAPWQDSVMSRDWRADYHQVWERRSVAGGVQFFNAPRGAFIASDVSVNGGFGGFTTDASKATFETSSPGTSCGAPSPAPAAGPSCGSAGAARFGCCPQLPYGRLDAGRRSAELAICKTYGEPHIIDFSDWASQTYQITHEEGDYVLYEGKLLEVSVRQVGFRKWDGTTSGSGNNAWTMTGALIGFNTIEYFGSSELSSQQTVVDRATTEVYWNGQLTSMQELCDVHLADYVCSCKYDAQVSVDTSDILNGQFPSNVNRNIEIVFNEDYFFRSTMWWEKYGWSDITLTVDPQNVGKPGIKLGANGVQETVSTSIATGSVSRGGLCNKGGVTANILDYKIDCSSNNAFLVNRLGGSMLINDPVHAAAFCYRRRRAEPIQRRVDLTTGEEHVANVLNSCDSNLKREAEAYCGICDAKAANACIFDACAVGSLRGALGSRNHCQETLLIAAAPGQEGSICDADQMWDAERQICRDPSWSPDKECAPGADCGGDLEDEQPDCTDKIFAQTCVQSFVNAGGCSLSGTGISEEQAEAALSTVDTKCFMCESVGAAAQDACRNQSRSPMQILREIIDYASELEKADLPSNKNDLTKMKRSLSTATKSLGRVRGAVIKAAKATKPTKGSNKKTNTKPKRVNIKRANTSLASTKIELEAVNLAVSEASTLAVGIPPQ